MGKRRSSFVASDNSDDERPAKVSKKVKKGSSSKGGSEVDSEGNTFWDLSNKRRIVVQKFKGNVFVNLREYYEDNKSGEMKPGKKGIMLSAEQYQTLVSLVPAISSELRKNGIAIDGEDDKGDEPAEKPAKKAAEKSKKPKKSSKKANIDVTSEEEEEEEEDDNDDE